MNDFLMHFGPGVISVLFGYLVLSVVGYFVIKSDFATLKETVKDHAENFKRVIWRDECDKTRSSCVTHANERHTEVIKRLDRLELSFKTCMDDLVDALQKGKGDL